MTMTTGKAWAVLVWENKHWRPMKIYGSSSRKHKKKADKLVLEYRRYALRIGSVWRFKAEIIWVLKEGEKADEKVIV